MIPRTPFTVSAQSYSGPNGTHLDKLTWSMRNGAEVVNRTATHVLGFLLDREGKRKKPFRVKYTEKGFSVGVGSSGSKHHFYFANVGRND